MPDAPNCCVLFASSNTTPRPIPLKECRVTAFVRDAVAQITLEQTYVNNEDVAIEATYLFPIHPAGAVNKFEVTRHDGRKFVGVIKKKGQAKHDYDSAIESGHGAYLLEQTQYSEEIFQSSIGNLEPGLQVTITIGYVTVVDNDEEPDSLRFVVPTTIAPRYRPAETAESGKKQTVQAEYSVSVPYTVSVDLTFETSRPIKSVVSPSHSIVTQITEDLKEAHVKFTAGGEQLDRDIVVVLNGNELDNPLVVVERLPDSDSVCAMLSFVPRFVTSSLKSEFVFLIDTSGSMGGFKVQQAKAALNLLVRSLPVDCFFNVYEFNHSFRSKFPTSVKYSEETLHSAIAFINNLVADGGTELLHPLRQILPAEPLEEHMRQVILLTDGEVSNVEELKSLASNHAKHSRIFTIGIGNAVSHELVDGLSRAANGTAVYIMENESFSKKVIQQLERAVQPAFTNLKVDWHTKVASADAQQSQPTQELAQFVQTDQVDQDKKAQRNLALVLKRAPFISPPIFKGSRYTAFAIGPQALFADYKATISGNDEKGNEFKLQVGHDSADASCTLTGSLLHSAAVRKLIEELAIKKSYLHNEADISNEQVDEVIETLSLQYNLVSAQTSFVCIEERELPEWRKLSIPERRNVPILGDKHGGDVPRIQQPQPPQPPQPVFMAMAFASRPMAMACHRMMDPAMAIMASPMPKAMLDVDALPPGIVTDGAACDDEDIMFDSVAEAAPAPEKEEEEEEEIVVADEAGDKLQNLLRWQSFDGSFKLVVDFCTFTVGKSEQEVAQLAAAFAESEPSISEAWNSCAQDVRKVIIATLVALGFLLTEMEARKNEWNMIADKAVTQLNARLKQLTRAEYEKLARSLILDKLRSK